MNVSSRLVLSAILPFVLGATPALAANVACGDVIDGTTVVLDGDVGPCAPSLKVTVQNGGTLDLNGNTISCDGGMFGIAVLVNNGGTVRNGTVTGCEFSGIQVGGATGAVVENVISRNNTGTGFTVYSTGPTTLRYNTASQNDDDGFYVSASGSRLTSNSAWDNGSDGFAIAGSNVLMTGNRAVENFSYGFALAGNAMKLKSNSSTANGGMGYYVTGNENLILGSVSDADSYAFYISGSDNLLSKSLVSSGTVGLYLNGDANTISGNRFADGSQGITQSAFADNNVLKKNQAWGNTGNDFSSETITCGTNTWTGNKGGSRTDACMQ